MSPFQGFLNFIVLTQGSAALHPGLFCNAPSALESIGLLEAQARKDWVRFCLSGIDVSAALIPKCFLRADFFIQEDESNEGDYQ